MGKHKPNNQSRQKIRINTALGEAELTRDATVQVYIDGKNSVLKQVKDLQPGDRVLFKKSAITTSLETDNSPINELLEKNPFYRHAREQVYDFYNTEQDNGTLLRKLTLEGLISHGYLADSAEIREKIKQGKKAQLSEDEKYLAIEGLKEIVSQNNETSEKPTDWTFENWVRGGYVLTWNRYLPLLSEINPTLSDFAQDSPRRQAYNFWKTCRQQITKRLHHGEWNGNGKPNGKKAKDKENENRNPNLVVSDIVNQIAQNYDADTAIAQIVSTEQVKPNDKPDSLSAIVLRGKEEAMSNLQAFKDARVMDEVFGHIVTNYFKAKGVYSLEAQRNMGEFRRGLLYLILGGEEAQS